MKNAVDLPIMSFDTQQDWEIWLAEHYADSKGIWLKIANFRQRLDAVLHTRDVKHLSQFLIAKKPFRPGQPADPEFAMWMVATQCRPF